MIGITSGTKVAMKEKWCVHDERELIIVEEAQSDTLTYHRIASSSDGSTDR